MSLTRMLSVVAVLGLSSLVLADANMDTKVKLPARLVTGEEALRIIHEQTGLKYAYPTGALVRQIDGTPFADGAAVKDIVAKLAAKATLQDGIVVLENGLGDSELKKLTDQLKFIWAQC